MADSKKETSEQKVQRLIGFSKNERIVLGLLLLFIAISPILFSQFSTIYSFTDTGAIGDTIGGISAPFVNLLAAYLVYKSFTAQIRANAQQREDHNEQMAEFRKEYHFNYIRDLYSLISSEYYSSNKTKKSKSWVSSFLERSQSFNKENQWLERDGIGRVVRRLTDEEIIDIINQDSIKELDKIRIIVDNIKIFSEELSKVGIESGLLKYYTLRIEEIIKDSEIWMLADFEILENVFLGTKLLFEFQQLEFDYIQKTILEIKKLDYKVNPY